MAVGSAIPMLDATDRVTGTVPYASGIQLPGMLVGQVFRSEAPHALIKQVHVEEAARIRGVVAVVTGDDLDELVGPDYRYGHEIRDQPVLARGRVRFVGEPVALVAAETAEQAQEALLHITVDYADLPAVFDPVEAASTDAPLLHDDLGDSNIFGRARLRHGDIEQGFEEADLVVEERYTSPPAQHVSLEPHATVAQWSPGGLTLWSGTQAPYVVRRVVADLFGLAPENVRVIAPPLGGGYGGKGAVRIEPMAAVLARKVGDRPVMLALSRAEEFVTVTKHAAEITIRSGVRRDGSITARQVTIYMNAGAYADVSPNLVRSIVPRSIGPYNIPAVRVEANCVYTNLPSAAAFRGAVANQATWAYESHTDTLAARLGIDPLEFRMRNLLHSGDHFATGEQLHGIHFDDCLRSVADEVGWDRPKAESAGPIRRGRGLAVMMKSTVPTSRSECRLSIGRDACATLSTSTVEMGQGAHTALAQIAAEALGIGVEQVRVVGPDTEQTPFDTTTSSSRSTSMMGGAVQVAAGNLILELRRRAAALLDRSVDAASAKEGAIEVGGPQGERLTFGEVLRRSGLQSLEVSGEHATEGGIDPETGQGIASPHWHQAAGACEVEVDTETGHLRIIRYAASSFAGRVINSGLVKLQNDGNVVFGLGPALMEEMLLDEGQVLNPNLSDYLIPSFRDLPLSLKSVALEDGGEVHGVGEMTLPPVAPAIGNAIYDAVGIRIRHLPLTPEKILRALDEG